MSAETPWTPYGLEAIRTAHLRRRRFLVLAIVAGIAILWLLMFSSTTSTNLSVLVNNKEQSGGIALDIPEEDNEDDKPVTVAIDPGRVTRTETTGSGNAPIVQRSNVPTFDRAAPYNWNYYVLLYGPYVLLGLAVYALGQRRGKNDEINYGIYKGAMPLEMISAAAQKDVFTTRHARTSIFGKRRGDYLPPEVVVERVEQEDA